MTTSNTKEKGQHYIAGYVRQLAAQILCLIFYVYSILPLKIKLPD